MRKLHTRQRRSAHLHPQHRPQRALLLHKPQHLGLLLHGLGQRNVLHAHRQISSAPAPALGSRPQGRSPPPSGGAKLAACLRRGGACAFYFSSPLNRCLLTTRGPPGTCTEKRRSSTMHEMSAPSSTPGNTAGPAPARPHRSARH